jgi:hypothetical protein
MIWVIPDDFSLSQELRAEKQSSITSLAPNPNPRVVLFKMKEGPRPSSGVPGVPLLAY